MTCVCVTRPSAKISSKKIVASPSRSRCVESFAHKSLNNFFIPEIGTFRIPSRSCGVHVESVSRLCEIDSFEARGCEIRDRKEDRLRASSAQSPSACHRERLAWQESAAGLPWSPLQSALLLSIGGCRLKRFSSRMSRYLDHLFVAVAAQNVSVHRLPSGLIPQSFQFPCTNRR